MKVVAVRGALIPGVMDAQTATQKKELKHGKGTKFLCRQKQDFLSSPSTMASVPNLLKPSQPALPNLVLSPVSLPGTVLRVPHEKRNGLR